MNLPKAHSKIALGYFLIAALLGLVLRLFYVLKIPITFKFFVHTHSHIALLGWVYVALTTLIYKLYLEKLLLHKKYKYIFGFTQLTLVGMLFSFPFQGYALFSIIFSTSFLIASYWFFLFFRKRISTEDKKLDSYKCIVTALWYMVISSIGPWALGGIMSTLGATSIWYRLAIYFYLHFQYNGWMVLALIGVLFYILERKQIYISQNIFKKFFWFFNIGIILSFFLSTLFTNPSIYIYFVGGLGGTIQLLGFGFLIQFLIKQKKEVQIVFSKLQLQLLKTIILFLLIKMALQLLTSLPYFANLAVTIMDFTIGYLHWTFLGVVTISLFLFFDYFKLMQLSKKAYYIYLLGFGITEGLIFYKGFIIWQKLPLFNGYFNVLAVGSICIVLSLLLLFIKAFRTTEKE